jgi:hypothetical protein
MALAYQVASDVIIDSIAWISVMKPNVLKQTVAQHNSAVQMGLAYQSPGFGKLKIKHKNLLTKTTRRRRHYFSDTDNDCGDASDEKNCSKSNPGNKFEKIKFISLKFSIKPLADVTH